jgi:hypothetical protein
MSVRSSASVDDDGGGGACVRASARRSVPARRPAPAAAPVRVELVVGARACASKIVGRHLRAQAAEDAPSHLASARVRVGSGVHRHGRQERRAGARTHRARAWPSFISIRSDWRRVRPTGTPQKCTSSSSSLRSRSVGPPSAATSRRRLARGLGHLTSAPGQAPRPHGGTDGWENQADPHDENQSSPSPVGVPARRARSARSAPRPPPRRGVGPAHSGARGEPRQATPPRP